ncbi:MAG: PAS domain S-box protein [Thermogemmatispora sp.]|uniref:PAS domain-containing sensor histidine kinase n=1 Tax=Thermogemmatispora sp. TaxID=1968838 RepID=UPI0019DDFFA1|nr:PAS domain S-box protein [Thermogemmatispora sp.]MBE3565983.1 PAS domain S-box protein [Thermogemmatispora sp.]
MTAHDPQGEGAPEQGQGEPVPSAFPPIVADVTSALFRQFLDLLPDALIVVDEQGYLVQANAQATTVFGYSREELLGQSLDLLLPERFREIHRRHAAHYFKAPRLRPMGIGLRLFARRKDNSEIPVEISLSPLRVGEQLYVIAAVRDMTAQRRAEREKALLLQNLSVQGELLNQAYDAIIVRDPLDRILLWNRGAERLYGWPAQEALGRISTRLLKTGFPEGEVAVRTVLEQNGQWEGELTQVCRDGRLVVVESRQALVRDQQGQVLATLEINRDISERRQRERETQAMLAGHLSLLEQLFEALPFAVALVAGEQARLLLANQAVRRVWGTDWPPGLPFLEFLQRHGIVISDQRGKALTPEELVTLRVLREQQAISLYQEQVRRADGTLLPVLVSALPLHVPPEALQGERLRQCEPGEPLALVIHQDVTPLKEADELKDEFISIAAHELRTPLAALTGYAEMLLRQTERGHGPPLATWQREALEEIQQGTARLVSLTEELLDLSRLQAGRLQLQRLPADLVPLVRQVVRRLQPTTARHQLTVQAPAEPLVALIDPHRLEQVLTNLVENAIKYSPQGGPVEVRVVPERDGRAILISVQDHGIGIPRHQQGQIGGRFMRAENARAWGIEGTGLGLYLARALVEQHGGRLWFESEEGQGSTFFVRLPLLREESEEGCEQRLDSEASAATPGLPEAGA